MGGSGGAHTAKGRPAVFREPPRQNGAAQRVV